MHKLMKALASGTVTVKNVTSGEMSIHYPELAENGYPTGTLFRLGIAAQQTITLTDVIPLKALKLSSNLKKLVKARHLSIIL
jgi:hypothetical protein